MALPDEVADRILGEIIRGRFPAESLLPPEGELTSLYAVSRLTVREAVRILRSQNVVAIRRGRGTLVNRPERWTSLDAVVRSVRAGDSAAHISERLLEARVMVEVGAVRLAAVRRSKEDLAELESCLSEMRSGADAGNVDLFVEADISFHSVIMRASGNVFVPFMFEPFGNLLIETRRETSTVPRIQQHAIAHHESILESLVAGDEDGAHDAMETHMKQTREDLLQYVRNRDTGG